MKLMIASDIHGSALYCGQMLEAYRREGADRLLILGDILYHGPRNDLPKGYAPKEVIAMLNPMKTHLLCVRGNCDTEVDQMVLEFPMRGDYSELYLDGHRFFFTHGHLYDEEHLPMLKAGDVFMYGHIHKPVLKKENDITIFNPSSISLPKAGQKSFGIYENGELKIVSFDKKVLQSIKI